MVYYEIHKLYQEHISIDDLIELLKDEIVCEYYGILHDKDLKDTGELKKAHYHLIVGLKDKNEKPLFINHFQEKSKCGDIKAVKKINSMVRYLTHIDYPSKYQYSKDDVFTNNIEMFDEYYSESVLSEKKSSATDLLLEKYIQFVESNYEQAVYLTGLEILTWFRKNNGLSYYIQHKNNIDKVTRDIALLFENYEMECEENESSKC